MEESPTAPRASHAFVPVSNRTGQMYQFVGIPENGTEPTPLLNRVQLVQQLQPGLNGPTTRHP